MDYPRFAASMNRYFSRLESQHGAPWTSGRVAASAWQGVLERGTWSEADLGELDELMRAGDDETGSAWIEMRMFYDAWRDSAASVTERPT
ncbi:hypothetical protein E1265_31930 [Streptomyces sp. 8K308]|uniref:hypothetical protein n=1 Tax=Streptomyces sp. 8K308 TaxID=2530388 RepID=UPI00105196AE|nr:hypothetical protein [Streptomyces sp. 8K308]TDC09789.1 hypothetical protein E1265_31930 [Streptomyces sp. 8K308]